MVWSLISAQVWKKRLKKRGDSEGIEKLLAQKYLFSSKWLIRSFDILSILLVGVIAGGAVASIWDSKSEGGNMMAFTGTVLERVSSKAKENIRSTKEKLTHRDKELNKKFLKDIINAPEDLKIALREKVENSKIPLTLGLLDIPKVDGNDNGEEGSKSSDKKKEEREKRWQQLIKDLQLNWNDEIEKEVSILWNGINDIGEPAKKISWKEKLSETIRKKNLVIINKRLSRQAEENELSNLRVQDPSLLNDHSQRASSEEVS